MADSGFRHLSLVADSWVKSSHQSGRMRGARSLDFKVDEVFLQIDTAIPCGLIINELISNAFKHAFRIRQKGRVEIALQSSPDGGLVLTVSDDGVGLPLDFDWQNATSFGLRLVKDLTAQVGGTINLLTENGTHFTLTFRDTPRPAQKAMS